METMTRTATDVMRACMDVLTRQGGPDGIARFLGEQRVRGVPTESESCPIAVWVAGHLGVHEVPFDHVTVGHKWLCARRGRHDERIVVPEDALRFIVRFDAGDYADLVRRAKRT